MLRLLQRVRAQVISARWRGVQAPRTPSRTSNEELVAVRGALIHHAAAIVEYTDTCFFAPELNKEGAEVPPDLFGLNPEDGEDSPEEIASSDEGGDEESEDGEDAALEDGADGQPQLDCASSNEPHASTSIAVGDDQAETHQPTTPPAGAADSTNLPDPPAAPLA